ncbi:MAG: hypothetical protein HWD59_00355 [Coxiellaceae bacterium]|nr:MAG: hypothetical protein HWD59_00355 [Coxiellaceae bacterium]
MFIRKSPISDANELAPTLSDNEFTAKLQVLEVHASATKTGFCFDYHA